jgi:hypothetical protein
MREARRDPGLPWRDVASRLPEVPSRAAARASVRANRPWAAAAQPSVTTLLWTGRDPTPPVRAGTRNARAPTRWRNCGRAPWRSRRSRRPPPPAVGATRSSGRTAARSGDELLDMAGGLGLARQARHRRRCARSARVCTASASPSTKADRTGARRSHSCPDSIPAYRSRKLLRPSARHRFTLVKGPVIALLPLRVALDAAASPSCRCPRCVQPPPACATPRTGTARST